MNKYKTKNSELVENPFDLMVLLGKIAKVLKKWSN